MATGCLRSTSYLFNNHKGKRFDGGNGLEMLPIYVFPIGTFSCSPFLLSPEVLLPKGTGQGGYHSEHKIHREEEGDISFRMEGGIEALRE